MTSPGHGARRGAGSALRHRWTRVAPGWPTRLANPFTDGGALAVAATVLATRVAYALVTRFLFDDAFQQLFNDLLGPMCVYHTDQG